MISTRRLWQLLLIGLLVVVALSVVQTLQSIRISQEVSNRLQTFTFSAEALSRMKSRGVPDALTAKLAPLKDQTIIGADELSDVLAAKLQRDEVDTYAQLIRRSLQGSDFRIEAEKTRQDAIEAAIANERRHRFWTTLFDTVISAVTISVAVVGALVGLFQYLGHRGKEDADRATAEFAVLYEKLASEDDKDVASALAGMQRFLTPENERFHAQIVGGLALVGRLEDKTTVVRKTLRPVIERAFEVIASQIITSVSWQKLNLHNLHLKGRDLTGIDFTDAELDGADFSDCVLRNAKLERASLRGGVFHAANLSNALLANADLSEANFTEAVLTDADLLGATLVGSDFKYAQLTQSKLATDIERADWAFCKNWRDAKFDEAMGNRLQRIYGPAPSGKRVLMILWEFPPVVSGGGWTAAYHLVRNLRQKGSDITVLTPWKEARQHSPFGHEIPIIHTDMQGKSDGDQGGFSAYSAYSAYSGYSTTKHHSIIYAVNLFLNKVRRDFQFWETKDFDVIHAHDWLTFEVARWLAEQLNLPWIAHFHSTETIRQRDQHQSVEISAIEKSACGQYLRDEDRRDKPAAIIIVPSNILKQQLIADYKVDEGHIKVVPNTLSRMHHSYARLGDFHARKVVFVGRLSWQKAPERFVKIAELVCNRIPNADFFMFGKGEESEFIEQLINSVSPLEPLRVEREWRVNGFGFSRLLPIEAEYTVSHAATDYLQLERVPVGLLDELSQLESKMQNGKRIDATDIEERIERFCEMAQLSRVKVFSLLSRERRGAPLAELLRLQTEYKMFNDGFLVTPLQVDERYTHRIKIEARYSLSKDTLGALRGADLPEEILEGLSEVLKEPHAYYASSETAERLLTQIRSKLGAPAKQFEQKILSECCVQPEKEYFATVEPHRLPAYEPNWLPSYREWHGRLISLEGFQNWGNPRLTFQDASVLVVPSRHEPFGMVIPEAMRCGVPVVYCQQAGAAEVFSSGIQFDPEDVEEAAIQVERLLTDQNYWVRTVVEQLADIRTFGTVTRNQFEDQLRGIWDDVSG